MKDFGTDSTAINSPTRKSNGTKDTKKSHSAQPQGVAKFSALGDEAFKKKDHEAAVNYYMQSIRLLTPKNPDEGQLDLKHCKKNCVLTSMFLKVSRAYLQDEYKEEAQKSLQTAEVFIRKVVNNEMGKENGSRGDISMVEYSSFTLLSKVMEGHGDTHLLDGDFTMAEEAFQEAIAFKRKSLNIIRTEDVVAKVFNNKIQINLELASQLKKNGEVLQKRGDYGESTAAYSEALRIRHESKQENSHREVLCLLNSLADVYRHNGEFAAGLECLDVLTRIYEKEEESKELFFMNTLKKSELHVVKKEYTQAMDVATSALDMVNSQGLEYNERLLNRAIATEQIARILVAQAQFHDAILWHKRAHSIRSEILPETHELVLKSMTQIARIYRKQGEYNKAKALFKEMRDKLMKKHGIEHASMADLLDDLGCVYSEQKDFSSALRCHKKALEIRRTCRKEGDQVHSDIAITLEKIAILCLNRDRILAMKLFSEALYVLRQNHFCRQHPVVIRIIREMSTFDHEEDAVESTSVYMQLTKWN